MNKKKTFNLLLVAQSLSAFGDNAVYSVIMGMLLALVKSGDCTLVRFGVESAIYANCLFLPYVVLAPVLGWISDRFSKKNVLISANAVKALGCLTGFAGAALGGSTMLASYLMIGVGAAVYSPAKYGIIPELKDESALVKANAAMEMTTILSILTGIIGGGLLVDNLGVTRSFFVLFAVYCASICCNCLMDNSHIHNRDEAFAGSFHDFTVTLATVFTNKCLYVPVIGVTIFWSSASFTKLNLQTWAQHAVKLSTATGISLLALWLSIGIVIGSFIAGRFFKTGRIKRSWIFGCCMGVIIIVMVGRYSNYGLLVAELILLGTCGGLFVVPLNAAIQAKSNLRQIGKVIAVQNFFENIAMLASTALFWGLNKLSLTPVVTFLVAGVFLCLINLAWLRPALGAHDEDGSMPSAAEPVE